MSPAARRAGRGGRAPAIDIHAHYFPEAYPRAVETRGEHFGVTLDRSDPTGPAIKVGAVLGGHLRREFYDLRARLEAMDRAGVQVHALSGRNGKELDDPSFTPVVERIHGLGLPVFLHPLNVVGAQRLAPYYLGNLLGNPYDTVNGIDLYYEVPGVVACVTGRDLEDRLAAIPIRMGRSPRRPFRRSIRSRMGCGSTHRWPICNRATSPPGGRFEHFLPGGRPRSQP